MKDLRKSHEQTSQFQEELSKETQEESSQLLQTKTSFTIPQPVQMRIIHNTDDNYLDEEYEDAHIRGSRFTQVSDLSSSAHHSNLKSNNKKQGDTSISEESTEKKDDHFTNHPFL